MNFYKNLKPLAILLGLMVGFSWANAQRTATPTNIPEEKAAHNVSPDQAKVNHYNSLTAENGMPVYRDNNMPEIDGANYEAEKAEWISNNPSLYAQMERGESGNEWIGSENNGAFTTHYVKMNGISNANEAAEMNAKYLDLPEVQSSNIDASTKVITITVKSEVTLEELFDITQ